MLPTSHIADAINELLSGSYQICEQLIKLPWPLHCLTVCIQTWLLQVYL